MKPITAEWVAKAEGDFATLERESRARKNPNYDAVSFHAQQCAEKYLKARLCEAGIAFGKTHDLVFLLDKILPLELSWETLRNDLAILTEYGTRFRYPGGAADRKSALDAQRRCRAFRRVARQTLGVEV